MNKANLLFEALFNTRPAHINAKTNNGRDMEIETEGRGLELLSLSLATSEEIIKKVHISVDEYCQILKEGYTKHSMSKEDKAKAFDEAVDNLADFLKKRHAEEDDE